MIGRFVTGAPKGVAQCAAAAIVLAAAWPLQVDAADYPLRPIQMIIPFAAGGGFDQTARNLAQALPEVLKQPTATPSASRPQFTHSPANPIATRA